MTELPKNYDYVGVYLTNKCFLNCDYCITKHHNSDFGGHHFQALSPDEWVEGLNKLILPRDVPVTLQGGEPFLYKGIKHLLEKINHKVDILTALPPQITRSFFESLDHLEWNRREAPYPTIRVSYHPKQHDYRNLVDRVATFNDLVSVGVYYLDHPDLTEKDIDELRSYAADRGVELRKKEFLGFYNGVGYGEFLYQDATIGKPLNKTVYCRNTVVPIAPDGTIYRCHSDLYFLRKQLALGNILDDRIIFPDTHLPCEYYGLCSECDVKVKTNHYQIGGYTSVDIKFEKGELDDV